MEDSAKSLLTLWERARDMRKKETRLDWFDRGVPPRDARPSTAVGNDAGAEDSGGFVSVMERPLLPRRALDLGLTKASWIA
jgi:hypothetical protein